MHPTPAERDTLTTGSIPDRPVVALLSAADHAALPGMLFTEEHEEGADPLKGTLVSLDTATVADLKKAVILQRKLVDHSLRQIAQEIAMQHALVSLLILRQSQGVNDEGRAWDATLVARRGELLGTASFSTGSCMETGKRRLWHALNDDGTAGSDLFAIVNAGEGFRVEQPDGTFIGLLAEFEAARLAGFAWLERKAETSA